MNAPLYLHETCASSNWPTHVPGPQIVGLQANKFGWSQTPFIGKSPLSAKSVPSRTTMFLPKILPSKSAQMFAAEGARAILGTKIDIINVVNIQTYYGSLQR